MQQINIEVCKICDSSNNVLEFIDSKNKKYYFCRLCEYIFLAKEHVISPEDEKKRYSFHQNNMSNEGYVRMFHDFINKTVIPYKTTIRDVLEFGCGHTPVLAELLREHGFRVVIYDKYFYDNQEYRTQTFDLITTTEVLEHLSDPLATLRILRSVLAPKGKIACMTLFHPRDVELFKDWWYRIDDTHISFFNKKTLRIIAEKLDMNIIAADDKNICVLEAS